MMKVDSLTTRGSQWQATNSIAASASADVAERVPAAGRSTSISARIQRHGQWALLGQSQMLLSRMQLTEHTLTNTYRSLLNVMRQLELHPDRSSQLASQTRGLARQIAQGNVLAGDLSPRARTTDGTYMLSRVNLLAQREQPETIRIRLPNNNLMTLRLPAAAGQQELLSRISSYFVRQGIQIQVDGQGRLVLTGHQSLFDEAWMFQGQGVRVPAGNPVPIRLDAQPQSLLALALGLEAGQIEAEKQRLRSLLKALERHRQALKSQRMDLLAKIERMDAAQSDMAQHTVEQLGQELSLVMRESHFATQMNTLMAQANVSRQTVVALLSKGN